MPVVSSPPGEIVNETGEHVTCLRVMLAVLQQATMCRAAHSTREHLQVQRLEETKLSIPNIGYNMSVRSDAQYFFTGKVNSPAKRR